MSRYTRRGQRERFELQFGMPDGAVGRALREALAGYEPRAGELIQFEVRHDSDCPIWNRRPCACVPDADVINWWRGRAGGAS